VGTGLEGTCTSIAVAAYRSHPSSLVSSSDVTPATPLQQILINSGECVSRSLSEARVKLTNLTHLLLTRTIAATVAGSASLIFGLSERGTASLGICGPANCSAAIECISSYVNRRYPVLQLTEPPVVQRVLMPTGNAASAGPGCTLNVIAIPIPLQPAPSPHAGSLAGQKRARLTADGDGDCQATIINAVCYVVYAIDTNNESSDRSAHTTDSDASSEPSGDTSSEGGSGVVDGVENSGAGDAAAAVETASPIAPLVAAEQLRVAILVLDCPDNSRLPAVRRHVESALRSSFPQLHALDAERVLICHLGPATCCRSADYAAWIDSLSESVIPAGARHVFISSPAGPPIGALAAATASVVPLESRPWIVNTHFPSSLRHLIRLHARDPSSHFLPVRHVDASDGSVLINSSALNSVVPLQSWRLPDRKTAITASEAPPLCAVDVVKEWREARAAAALPVDASQLWHLPPPLPAASPVLLAQAASSQSKRDNAAAAASLRRSLLGQAAATGATGAPCGTPGPRLLRRPVATFLGTGAAAPSALRSCSCIHIHIPTGGTVRPRGATPSGSILLDCGEGATQRLMQLAASLGCSEADVFLGIRCM
jgi:hypothetical protein